MNQAYDPHGQALHDCFHSDTSAMLICYPDGERDDVPAGDHTDKSASSWRAQGISARGLTSRRQKQRPKRPGNLVLDADLHLDSEQQRKNGPPARKRGLRRA